MTTAADITAIIVAAINLATALLGAWAWRRNEPSRAFWILARAGQFGATALAALAVVLLVGGYEASDNLLYLYLLLPIVVSIVAEQLRIASAQTVLDVNDLEDAQAVGRLPDEEQQAVVMAIIRREIGVMALGALVIAFLALRVLGTT